MAIGSYPRTIQNGQLATNGNANSGTGLMLWDSSQNKYIAAVAETFNPSFNGAASQASQDTQITEAQTANSYLSNISDNTQNTNDSLQTLIGIFKGIEPSLLSAGIPNLPQGNGVQIGNTQTNDTTIGIVGSIGIKGVTGNIAEVNASNQLKTTAV